MSVSLLLRRSIATAIGFGLACLAVDSASKANAEMVHKSFGPPTAATVYSAAFCLCSSGGNDSALHEDGPATTDEKSGDATDEKSSDPASGTSFNADPQAGGGPGPNGQPPTSGKATSFGTQGSFSPNGFRRSPPSGYSGMGGGGGGGGGFGGGFAPFLAGGSSTTSSSDPGGGSISSSGGGISTDRGPVGSSLSNPILPDPGTSYTFHYTIDPGGLGNTTPLFFDPPVATSYFYQILSGPNFASVEVPNSTTNAGQHEFTLTFGTFTEDIFSGTPFFFTSVVPGGVSQFRITEDLAESDPNGVARSLTFDTAITFVGGGDGSFSQTPVFSTPEPGSLTLWGLSAAGIFGWKWSRGRRERTRTPRD